MISALRNPSMKIRTAKTMLLSLASCCLLAAPALACPAIDGMIDFNCDGRLKIAITGDSVVKGDGDSPARPPGGYVTRLAERFPKASFVNLGIDGVTSFGLLRNFTQILGKGGTASLKRLVKEADLIIIDVGRNDYFQKHPASYTINNIERLVKLFRRKLADPAGSAPFVAISTLIPTTRSFQQPFVAEVNRFLITSRSPNLPVYIRLDGLPLSDINFDGIHPNSLGYDEIARIDAGYIRVKAQQQQRKLRRDADSDGIFDIFESKRYLTNPRAKDTDGDGLSDGDEIFVYLTNPLALDSDGDGVPDGSEVDVSASGGQ